MDRTKRQGLMLVLALSISLCSLADGACVQEENGGPVHCCDQREHGGSLQCCGGRNSSCGMEDYVHNTICYCDEFCETAADCCPDFESVKRPCGWGNVKQDCVVSPWSDWGPCSPRCGIGFRRRTRTVTFRPMNGGRECPPLIENSGCFTKLCGGKELGFARILPYKFKKERAPSVWDKILPAPREEVKTTEAPKRPSYCIHYKVHFKHPHCRNTWADKLDPQTPICVECQDEAMNKHGKCKGQGLFGDVTLWEAVDLKSCYGGWLKIGPKIPNFFEHNNYFYKFVFPEDGTRTWYEAETLCKTRENGHLTSLVSNREIEWVNGVIKNAVRDSQTKVRLWIGGNDQRINDVWDFLDGEPLRYNVVPWAPGQPWRPLDVHYAYCVSLEFEGESSRWYVEDCFKAHGYICKSKQPSSRITEKKRFGYSWEWGNHIYKFFPLPWTGLSWTEAEEYCTVMEKGHLLSIRSRKESRWVTDRIRQIRQVIGFRKLWIGASDFGHEGEYEWSAKKLPVTFQRWANGEPSHFSKHHREDCIAIRSHPDWGKWSDESCVMEHPFICKTRLCLGKTDLAFMVDSSTSVGESNFQEAKDFVWSVVRNFPISNNDTRVAVIRYSSQADVIFDFQFSAKNNVLFLKETLDNMEYVGGETKTELALDLARTGLFTEKRGSRTKVPKILVVMSNGKSEDALAVARTSMALKRQEVTVVVVAIGDEVDLEELLLMASTPEDVISVSTFSTLKKRVGKIRDKVCDEMVESQNRRELEEEEENSVK